MTKVVLDASAVLALLNGEPGADQVATYVAGGTISAVNSAEVIGKLMESGMPEARAAAALDMLALEVIIFDARLAVRTGALRPLTKHAGLSLGDRACLATGELLELSVVTMDRTWASLGLGVTVELAR